MRFPHTTTISSLWLCTACSSASEKDDKWFTGVVTTDGAGSPRDDLYADYTDEQMKQVRIVEQKKAAYVGEYAAQLLLGYTSKEVKDGKNEKVIEGICV